jgi:hypothetical protein
MSVLIFATFGVGIAASRFKCVLIFTKKISQNLLRAGALVDMLVTVRAVT